MTKRIQLLTLLLVVATLCAVGLIAGRAKEGRGLSAAGPAPEWLASAAQADPPRREKTADEGYKSIQVLKGVAASQLEPVMAFFTGSLGVRCSHCHVPGQFEKDDK